MCIRATYTERAYAGETWPALSFPFHLPVVDDKRAFSEINFGVGSDEMQRGREAFVK